MSFKSAPSAHGSSVSLSTYSGTRWTTASQVARDTTAFLESTGNTYLEKPFSIRSIAEALRDLEE